MACQVNGSLLQRNKVSVAVPVPTNKWKSGGGFSPNGGSSSSSAPGFLSKQTTQKSSAKSYLRSPKNANSPGFANLGENTLNIQESEQDTGQIQMAGDIRLMDEMETSSSVKKKPRRHWTLVDPEGADRCCSFVCPYCLDRSAMSVNFLKANLAKDGCSDSQLHVAKKLLQDSNDQDLGEHSQNENARLAIYWLVKSSEQGNEEATTLLKNCLTSGRGITSQNFLDVKSCLSTPTNEKLTLQAAKLLYEKLSNGEKFITTTQLYSRIQPMHKKTVHFSEDSQQLNSNEESLNSTVTDEGDDSMEFPGAGLDETFDVPRSSPLASSSPSRKRQSSPEHNFSDEGEGEKLTLENLLTCAEIFNAGKSPQPAINRHHKELERHRWNFGSQLNIFVYQLLLLSYFTDAMSWNYCFILGAGFLSLWTSFNILGLLRRHLNFRDWSAAFQSVNQSQRWSSKEPEDRLILYSMLPYLFTQFLTVSICWKVDGLNSLKIVTGCLVIFSLQRSMQCRFPITPRIVALLIIINFPIFITHLIKLLESNVLEIFQEYIHNDLTKDLDLLSCGDKIFPIVQIAATITLLVGSKRKLVQRHFPELIIAIWTTKVVQICFDMQDDVLDLGLAFLSCGILLAAISIVHSELDMWKMIASVVTIIAIGGTFVFLVSEFMLENPIRITISSLRMSKDQVTIRGIDTIDKLPLLEWDQYDTMCHRRAWKKLSPAATQLNCYEKFGKELTAVRWRGRVAVVKIRDMKQSTILPSISDITFDIVVNLEGMSEETQSTWMHFGTKIDPSLEHPSPAIVVVSTTQILDDNVKEKATEFLLGLHAGDKIEFHGVLSGRAVGSLKPEIEHLQSLTCLKCASRNSPDTFYLHPPKTYQALKSPTPQIKTSDSDIFQSMLSQLKELLGTIFNTLQTTVITVW